MKRDKLYFEYFASICIKDNIGEKFKKICHSDAPDLKIKKECGIEVTQLGTQEEFLILSMFDKNNKIMTKEKVLKTANFMVTDDNVIIKTNEIDEENIWETIKEKIKKLHNGNYDGFEEYGIFMFLSDTTENISPQDIINVFKKQNKKEKYYRYIFINYGTDFYYYDIDLNKMEYYNISLKIKKYRNYALNKKKEKGKRLRH